MERKNKAIRAVAMVRDQRKETVHWTLKSAKFWLRDVLQAYPSLVQYAVFDDEKKIPIAMSPEWKERYGDSWV